MKKISRSKAIILAFLTLILPQPAKGGMRVKAIDLVQTIVHTLTGKTSPVAADEAWISDSAVSYVSRRCTLSNLATYFGSMAAMQPDLKRSLFFFAAAVDYSTSASKVAVKISDHSGATALAAKGKLLAAFIVNTAANAGGTATTLSIAKDNTPTNKMCNDVVITVADVVYSNVVGNCMMGAPVSGANAIVDPASEDIYAVAAADTSRSHVGAVYILLVFQKTA